MTNVCKQLRPTCIGDIAAINAPLPSRPYGFDPAFHCLQGGSVPDPL